MPDLPAISTVSTPTPEQVIAGFTPSMTAAQKVAAMLTAVPGQREIVLATRMPNGVVMAFCDGIGVGTQAALLQEALGQVSANSPMFAAAYGDTATGSGGTPMVGRAFTTIRFDKATVDTHKAYDPKTGIYTIPEDGTYLALAGVRIADGDITGVSYGIGVDTAAHDSPAFDFGGIGLPKRQGRQYQRAAWFNKGDPVRAFYYFDGTPTTYIAAELTILRIR